MSGDPLFIFAGNGPYQNRGCEAIVRGTINIIRSQYNNPRFVCLSYFSSFEQFENQKENEYDISIKHLSAYNLNKREAISNFYKPKVWKYIYHSILDDEKFGYCIYDEMIPYLSEARAVLSIGGDNYSLDYGKPTNFIRLDDLVIKQSKPLIIWGASVGPFDKVPEFEQYMSHHLQKVSGIFARESATVNYLRSIGVTVNVHPVADPAFLMEPVKPKGIEDDFPLEEGIGINLSPLMAKYVTGNDIDIWAEKAMSIIDDVMKKTGMPIYLIPHVTVPKSDDYAFMQRVLSLIGARGRKIVLVPPKYNAAETKWIISKMALFAGARTHATIAALSAGIPTLSFAYSIKAKGINQDIFGHADYCIDTTELGKDNVSKKILYILDNNESIRRELADKSPSIKSAARSAGTKLKQIVGE